MSTSPFVRGVERTPETVGEGIRRQVLSHLDDLMVVRVEFAAGAIGYAHAHPHRQITYVASGRFEVTVGDATTVLEAGDSFAAEAEVTHGAKALTDGTLIDCFTPARADFLPVER